MCTQTSAFDFFLLIFVSSKTSPNPKAVYPQTQNFTPKSWKEMKMDTNHCGAFTINHVLNLGLIACMTQPFVFLIGPWWYYQR